jgi:hypothetical protein
MLKGLATPLIIILPLVFLSEVIYNDKFAKLPELGWCGGNKTQNSLPLLEKSCPIAILANSNPKMNINDFIYENMGCITIF